MSRKLCRKEEEKNGNNILFKLTINGELKTSKSPF